MMSLSRHAAGRLCEWTVCAFFVCVSLFGAATTLCAIVNYGLHQPTFDQYKEYRSYLDQSFLTSVLMLENGHHPVIPAFVANIEIRWFAGNQFLQLAIGTSCVFIAWASLVWIAWRQRELPRHARTTAIMLATVGMLWLANARMLLQGVGQLQVYVIVMLVIVAILCTWRAARKDSWAWVAAASVACSMATFTFGSGVASFPTVIAVAFMLRMRWNKLSVPLLAAVLCILLYVLVLPGQQNVHDSLALRPLESLLTAAQWLSSPWANGLLGLADPPLQPWLPGNLKDPLGRTLVRTANLIVDTTSVSWQSISMIFGFIGILIFVARATLSHMRRAALNRYETLANGLCIFALVTAAIIGIGRLDYLHANPNQIYADRYLAWPCLFWSGLMLLLLSDACRLKQRLVLAIGLSLIIAMPIVLYPTHRAWAGWSAAVYQGAQRAAAAARSDVFDSTVFPDGADASRDDVRRTLFLLKQQRLAMFTNPTWKLLGEKANATQQDGEIGLDVRVASTLVDAFTGRTAARIEGAISHGVAKAAQGQLTILDDENGVAGFAEFSFISRDASALRMDIPRKRGFDGYIRDYHADHVYRLVLLHADTNRAVLLKSIDQDSSAVETKP
jgi:hypothetical protein